MDVNALKSSEDAKKFTSGDVIINESDKTSDEMFVILEGNVGLYKNYKQPTEKKIKNIGVGTFFGEMTLFLHKERSETAVAIDDVIVIPVGRSTAISFFQTKPQLAALLVKTLCQRLDEADKQSGETKAEAPASPTPPAIPSGLISDTPPPGFISDTPPVSSAPSVPSSLPDELFPEGHQVYKLESPPIPSEIVYKKTFKCPVCEKSFQAYAVRTTRLKLVKRDKDFRSHYDSVDTTYFEMVTCPECWFSNFESAYSQPIIARFKENKDKITAYKNQIGLDLTEDRSINAVFAGFFLALKGAPLFYKDPEMMIAKIWLRLMWLYNDVKDFDMELVAAKKAHAAYLEAFQSTDAGPEAVVQLCVLMGELSLIVKDLPNAKIFFVKARSSRAGSKAMLTQAEDGIETIRKIEAGQIRF